MKTSLATSKLAALLALSAAFAGSVFTAGCAATRTTESTGQYVDDTVITTRVKSALLGDDSVKSMAVGVETLKGVVQLSGFVDTPLQRAAAGRTAASVEGVRDVKNNLIVK
jgi:osmotically-inducible protein OsmY